MKSNLKNASRNNILIGSYVIFKRYIKKKSLSCFLLIKFLILFVHKIYV